MRGEPSYTTIVNEVAPLCAVCYFIFVSTGSPVIKDYQNGIVVNLQKIIIEAFNTLVIFSIKGVFCKFNMEG